MERALPQVGELERWRDKHLLGLLLLLSLGLRLAVLWSTQVPARDSIGFITYALQLERFGWSWTLVHEHQHPAYPLAILAVSWPLRALAGLDSRTLQWSAQLVSVLAGVLLVWPMYYLGKQLAGRPAAFWGTLLFQCLPNSGRVLSDAISDPLFLLFLAGALACGVQGLRRRSWFFSALAGGCCGLAYLTRPEGALLLPAALLALLLGQIVPGWRQSWVRTVASMSAGLVAALLVASPYYLTTGCLTNKPSAAVALTGRIPAVPPVPAEPPSAEQSISSPQSQLAPPADSLAPSPPALPGPQVGTVQDILRHQQQPFLWRCLRACQLLLLEVSRCYQYVGWLPLFLGLIWFSGGIRRLEIWFMTLFMSLHAGVLWLLAFRAGYLSSRHALPLVLGSIYLPTAALWELPGRLAARWPAWLQVTSWWRWSPAGVARVLLLLLAGGSLCRTLLPLHYHNRAGHRAAGHWLARHAHPWDRVEDDHGWACYYADRFLCEEQTPMPPGALPKHYVVIHRNRGIPPKREEVVLQQGGQVVYVWPETEEPNRARVLIYLLPEKDR